MSTAAEIERKRQRARALFKEATGYEATDDWTHLTERNLDVLICCFRGMIVNDPRVLEVLREVMPKIKGAT